MKVMGAHLAVRGLVFDFDSLWWLHGFRPEDLAPFVSRYSCIFLTSSIKSAGILKQNQNCNNKLHTFAPHHTCGVMS